MRIGRTPKITDFPRTTPLSLFNEVQVLCGVGEPVPSYGRERKLRSSLAHKYVKLEGSVANTTLESESISAVAQRAT